MDIKKSLDVPEENQSWIYHQYVEMDKRISDLEAKQIHPSSAEYLTNQIYEIKKRIAELESKLGGEKKKRMDGLEERLNGMEEKIESTFRILNDSIGRLDNRIRLLEDTPIVGENLRHLSNKTIDLAERIKAIEEKFKPTVGERITVSLQECEVKEIQDALNKTSIPAAMKRTVERDELRRESEKCSKCGENLTESDLAEGGCSVCGNDPKREAEPQRADCGCLYESDCHGIEMIKSPSGKEWAVGGTNTKDRWKYCPWCGGTIVNYNEPKREPWTPMNGTVFYFITVNWEDVSVDTYYENMYMGKSLNIFRTRVEAERFLEIIKREKEELNVKP